MTNDQTVMRLRQQFQGLMATEEMLTEDAEMRHATAQIQRERGPAHRRSGTLPVEDAGRVPGFNPFAEPHAREESSSTTTSSDALIVLFRMQPC